MSEIAVRVNGVEALIEAHNLLDILSRYDILTDTKGVAVALNGQVIPRSLWNSTAIKNNDDIEIVHARQGG